MLHRTTQCGFGPTKGLCFVSSPAPHPHPGQMPSKLVECLHEAGRGEHGAAGCCSQSLFLNVGAATWKPRNICLPNALFVKHLRLGFLTSFFHFLSPIAVLFWVTSAICCVVTAETCTWVHMQLGWLCTCQTPRTRLSNVCCGIPTQPSSWCLEFPETWKLVCFVVILRCPGASGNFCFADNHSLPCPLRSVCLGSHLLLCACAVSFLFGTWFFPLVFKLPFQWGREELMSSYMRFSELLLQNWTVFIILWEIFLLTLFYI